MKFLLNFYLITILFHLVSKAQVIKLSKNDDIIIMIFVLAKYINIKYTLILLTKELLYRTIIKLKSS